MEDKQPITPEQPEETPRVMEVPAENASQSYYQSAPGETDNNAIMNDAETPDEFNEEKSLSKKSGADLSQPIAWQAPESVQGPKNTLWYVVFGIVVTVLMVLAIFVFKSVTFAVLLPVMGVALVVLSMKPPRMINYAISPKGVYVADKLHDFSEFRGFGVMQVHGQHAIMLLPVRRFSPGLTIYFSEAEGEAIVDMLGARLPMQEMKPDAIEKLIHLIRL